MPQKISFFPEFDISVITSTACANSGPSLCDAVVIALASTNMVACPKDICVSFAFPIKDLFYDNVRIEKDKFGVLLMTILKS